MTAVSLFRGSNMAAVTSCENRELTKQRKKSLCGLVSAQSQMDLLLETLRAKQTQGCQF